MSDQSLKAPDGLTWSYGASLVTDPENLSLTKTVKLNGTISPSWLVYDLSTYTFTIVTSHNNYAATHNVSLIIDDGYNAEVTESFLLVIELNTAPQKLKFISNVAIVNYNYLLIQLDPITELFSDPDGRTMTAELAQANGNPLPSFLLYDSVNNTLSGMPELVHVGEWIIAYTAVDDHNLKTSITFTINVDPWYFKCMNCTGEDYNQCTSCMDGYFLQFNQCRATCEGNYFEVIESKTCQTWHESWSICLDSTNTNWSSWNDGYFYYNNGCYETWPDGYYGDIESYTCKTWNTACTKWFGSTTNEWTECNNSKHYLLSGESECKLVSWVKGSYLNTTDLECYYWDEGCNMCNYPNSHYCFEWSSVYMELMPGTCTFWDDVTGYGVNEFGTWVEKWGDGLFLGEYEWDDGNSEAGDGWDPSWLIEAGFDCNETICWEIIKPTAFVSDVSRDNLVTVEFSEPVYFENYTTMFSSLRTNIDGSSSPYTYSIRIDNPPNPKSSFTHLEIQVCDIQASIIGGYKEKFEIWFKDLGVIKDMANNTLSSGKIIGYLNKFEYIPPAEEESAKSGGNSMKYTLISMFSINLLMKVVISSSAALMWSLIHVLQAFRYILMMNIQMPGLISILMTYLAIVIGEMDEMDALLPDVFNTYVVDSEALNQDVVVLARFEEYGYESPYLTDLYGKQITMLTCFIIFGMPTIYILMKALRTVRWIGPKLVEAWIGIFWNTPLRTFTELFVEISLGFFLNSLNIRFMTVSGVIATTILFIAGLFVITYPFALLSVISKPPLYVKTKRFNEKYGSLTEDVFKKRTLYQRSYYILFVFHRIILTGVLVYMYDYPIYQIVIVFSIQLSMIAYMMKLRPFKSELQQVISVTDEFTIIFGMILLYFLYKNQEDMVKSKQIGMMIIGIVAFSLMKNMGTIIYLSITNSYSKFKKWLHKKLNVKKIKSRMIKENRQKQAQSAKIEEELKKLEDQMLKGKLTQDQIWQPGSPSKIDDMKRVERSNSRRKLVEELKTTSSPTTGDSIANSACKKKNKTYCQQIAELTYESVMEERRKAEIDRKLKIEANKMKIRKRVTFADRVAEQNNQLSPNLKRL